MNEMGGIYLCQKSKDVKFKHAALIFRDGKLIASANNLGNYHAEVKALHIVNILGIKRNLVLMSLRVTRTGKLAMAMPCPSCLAYIKKQGGVKKILYSNERGIIVKL